MRTALITMLMIVSTLFSACGTRNAEKEMQDKPFKGVWQIVSEPEFDAETGRTFGMYEMHLNIDFYEKTVDNGIEKTYGGFYVANDRGDGNCDIVSFKIDGNKAYIEYEDPSTIIFSATLIYSPSDKTMTFIDGDVVDMQEASQSMIAQFHYLQQESILQPSKGNNNLNTTEEKKEPMGTFETILMLILSVGILIGVYYVLKIILGYVLCALLFGFIFGVIGLIAGYFISQPDMFSIAVVAAIVGAVIGLVIGIFGTKEWFSSPLASKVAKDLSKSDPNGTEYIARDQYGNTTKVKKTGRGILGETYYEDEDGNTYQKP